MSALSKKIFAERQLMTSNEHISSLKLLKLYSRIESTLRFLASHKLNDQIKESREIVLQLELLASDRKFGAIAHWILRQHLNSAGQQTLQPPEIITPKLKIKERQKVRRSMTKAKNLHCELSRSMIESKIERHFDELFSLKDSDKLNKLNDEKSTTSRKDRAWPFIRTFKQHSSKMGRKTHFEDLVANQRTGINVVEQLRGMQGIRELNFDVSK